MNEIYWITRFDNLCKLFQISTFLLIVIFLILFYVYYLYEKDEEKNKDPDNIEFYKTIRKAISINLILLSVSILLNLFVPTTKDMLLIYGVGGTIDYIEYNKKAKQLPDKCIQALDKILDEYINDKEDKTCRR